MDLPTPFQSAGGSEASRSLIGRAGERRVLRDHLAGARAGHGRLVLIGGEAGIGKTSLLRDLASDAGRGGVIVLTGHCYDLSSTPLYGPWRDLAARYAPDAEMPPLPSSLAAEGIEQITSQAAFFAEVRTFLADVSSRCPLLVILEDLHWADAPSLELLRYLAVHVSALPVLFAVTYRSDEPSQHQPFARQLPALVRDAEGLRLDVRRLERDDLRALVASQHRLSADDETRLVDYLDLHAEGNPLYIHELLRSLVEAKLLRQVGDRWRLEEIDRIVVPSYLRQVIDERVARLGDDMRQPLATAAVIGQEVSLDIWSSVMGLGEEELLTIVDRAVDAHLLEAAPLGTHVRFAHALTREALYEGVLAPRRRAWHRRVGEALSETALPEPDVVAFHFQQAGDLRAWEWLVRAGERAQRAYAWLTASGRFAAAAALLGEQPGHERTRGWLLYRSGRLRRYSQSTLGISQLAEAERLAAIVHDRTLAAEARYSRGVLRCFADDFFGGIHDLQTGLIPLEALPVDEALPSDTTSAWFADALPARESSGAADFDSGAIQLSKLGMNHRRGTLPWFMAAAGRLSEAQAIADGFLAKARTVSGAGELMLSATGHTLQGIGIRHALLGRPAEARAAFAEARAVYTALDHHAVIAFTLLSELEDIVLPYAAADLDERRRLAAEAEAALQRASGALPADVSPRRAWLSVLFIEGQWAEASAIAANTAAHGNAYLRRQANSVVAQLAHYRDDPETVRAYVRAVLPDGPATEPGGCVFADGLACQRMATDLEIAHGNFATAQAWLAANDRWLAWNDAVPGRAGNHMSWARYFQAIGDEAQARHHAAQALRDASHPEQPLALLTAHRLLGTLAGAEHLAAAEGHLNAALALADACAAPYERALTLLALAEVRLANRQVSEASDLLAQVCAICEPLGARLALAQAARLEATLASGPAPALPAGLTPRECEVLHLVAQGLTNAEAAARLSISERTVAQHLRTIYSKLDVTSRVGATRFAIDHGLT